MKIKPRAGRITTALLIACLMLPQTLWAQGGAVDENPDPYAMLGDFFVARPIGLVLTAGGTILWLVSLPFTLLSGSVDEAADVLILGPGEQTFVRCLGCRNSGYTHKDMDQREEREQHQQTAAVTDE